MIRLLRFFGLGRPTAPTQQPPVESHDDWLENLLNELRQPAYECGFERADWEKVLRIVDSGGLDVFMRVNQ